MNTEEKLTKALSAFGIRGKVTGHKVGPVVTTYYLLPEPGTRIAKVRAVAEDLALVLHAETILVVPDAKTGCIAFQVPSEVRRTIDCVDQYFASRHTAEGMALPVYAGQDTEGGDTWFDLAKTPHMLVAGQTGSGKSVGLNTLVVSLNAMAFKHVNWLMVDPKGTELKVYDRLPNMLRPVITDPHEAIKALNSLVELMEYRNRLFMGNGCRDIAEFNKKFNNAKYRVNHVVAIVDEFADLMITVGKELETVIARLAQKCRSTGIHLVLATQRPSVNVVTGIIKANFPTRMAFRVASAVDSNTIIGCAGAERLLGNGDMLFHMNGKPAPVRLHGAFISNTSVAEHVDVCAPLSVRMGDDILKIKF